MLLAAVVSLASSACGKDSRAATSAAASTSTASALAARPGADCAHSVCGDNFFIDTAPAGPCTIGSICTLTLTLVATGAFHINDEYPYKFKADELAGVDFLGTDGAGKNVFSKFANDWQKKDEKTGALSVKLRPTTKGDKSVEGLFKLSVCSAAACQLEQERVRATVAVR
jgi:hypothetical protein